MSDPIYFGCGEFVPGGEPITVGNLPTPSPTVIVPSLDPPGEKQPPFIEPKVPGPPKFKCVKTNLSFAPSPKFGFEYINSFFQYCLPCNGAQNFQFPDPPFNPNPNDSECLWVDKIECDDNCPNPQQLIPNFSQTQPPAGGPVFSPAATPEVPHKCRQTLFICPDDLNLANPRVLQVTNECIPCSPLNSTGSNVLQRMGSPVLKGSRGVKKFETDCIHSSKANCEANCPPVSPTGMNLVSDCNEPLSVASQSTSFVNPKDPANLGYTNVSIPGQAGGVSLGVTNVSQPTSNGGSFNVQVVNVEELGANQPTVSQNPVGTNSQIYHNTFNWFTKNQPISRSTFTGSQAYPEIFKNQVISNVGYLLNNQGSTEAWDESMLFSIKLEHIEQSLQPSLLAAFESIHEIGGQLVGKALFFQMIKRHLFEGTLSEVDPNYYITLASNQSNDRRVAYTSLTDRDASERAALGLVSEGSVTADSSSSQLINLQQRQSRRERRFLTDINARISNNVASGPVDIDLTLEDIGFDVSTLAGGEYKMTLGDGDGYYIPAKLADGTEIPLLLLTDVSSTFYVPAGVRFNALKLAKQDSSYTILATAVNGQNEFVAGDTGPSAIDPLYLTLDLSSVEFDTNANPLISNYKGTYNVEKDQDVIDRHAKNNGLSITRVNIDYRDPIFRYILDSGSLSLSLNDINLTTILDPKDLPNGSRIARNMPFGLIITPVMGSKHNPFNGQSKLENFVDPFVRTIRLIPDINITDLEVSKPDLEEVNLFNDTGGDLRVGLAEPNDTQNVIYKYQASDVRYTDTFYVDGEYTTSANIPSVSTNGISYMVRDVIDYIKTEYNPETITWYDVIRRMPLNRVGEFLNSTNSRIVNELERGFRDNIKIKSVLNTGKDLESSFLEDDDKTIIRESDR